MMRRRLYALVIAFALISGFMGCADQSIDQPSNPAPSGLSGGLFEGDITKYNTFEENLIKATDVFYATYLGTAENYIRRKEYSFQVNTIFKGQTEANIIYIPTGYYADDYDLAENDLPFTKGEEYLLVAERIRMVYYDHDRYVPYSKLVIPLTDLSKSMMNGTGANEFSSFAFDGTATVDDLSKYIEAIVSTEEAKQAPPYTGVPFTESSDLNEIIEASRYICKVKVKEEYNKDDKYAPTWIYICELVEQINGKFLQEDINESIYIAFFVGTELKQGDEFIVLLNKSNETDRLYSLSSKYSVRSVDEYEEITAILASLGKG